MGLGDRVHRQIGVPELREVWERLSDCPTLQDIADPPHRGIEWNVPLNTHESVLVRDTDFPDSRLGVPPNAKILSFQTPILKYLNFSKQFRLYDAFSLPWDKPKVIMSQTRRSRGMWRVAAFADFDGLACYQTFIALWPKVPAMAQAIAAILNGPVANAYLATHSSRKSFTHKTIMSVPIPVLTPRRLSEIDRLVNSYKETVAASPPGFGTVREEHSVNLLLQLDALILEAYGLTPRLERLLLDAFVGGTRVVPFSFPDYFPRDFTGYFTLKEWLTTNPALSTVGRFVSKSREITAHIKEALELACESREEDER